MNEDDGWVVLGFIFYDYGLLNWISIKLFGFGF